MWLYIKFVFLCGGESLLYSKLMKMASVHSFARIVPLLLLLLSNCLSDQKRHQLLFSYITTVTGGIRAIGGRPVVDLALEEINSRNDILQNYTLNYTTIRNSEVRYINLCVLSLI